MDSAMERQASRTRVTIPVGVLSGGQRETAYMEDVSDGGFKLRGLSTVKIGQILRIHAKGAMFDAEVRWINGATCGLRYHDDQCAGDLQRFLSQLPRLTKGKVKPRQVFREL